MSNILKFDVHQPFAHYREPKVMQDDYIPTLPLPPTTTIAGMISYLSDKRFKKPFDISVLGTFQHKDRRFIRGEKRDHWSKYQKFIKKCFRKKYGKVKIGGTKEELVNRIINNQISDLSEENLKEKSNKTIIK